MYLIRPYSISDAWGSQTLHHYIEHSHRTLHKAKITYDVIVPSIIYTIPYHTNLP